MVNGIIKINKESLERYNITYLKDLFIKDIRTINNKKQCLKALW